MANFVRSESIVSLNCCKDSEVIDIPRCYYTRWAGEDNVKEDLIILENLYPQVLLIYRKSSIRSRPLIQVYSIRSRTIYSGVPNKHVGWNKHVGRKIFKELIIM